MNDFFQLTAARRDAEHVLAVHTEGYSLASAHELLVEMIQRTATYYSKMC